MNKFLIFLVLSLVTCNLDLDTMIFQYFQKFIKKYQKKYNSVNEYLARYEVFKRNVLVTLQEQPTSYSTGITKFSDLTQQEFAKIYLNLNYDSFAVANFNPHILKVSKTSSDSLDWREKGYVSMFLQLKIKDYADMLGLYYMC